MRRWQNILAYWTMGSPNLDMYVREGPALDSLREVEVPESEIVLDPMHLIVCGNAGLPYPLFEASFRRISCNIILPTQHLIACPSHPSDTQSTAHWKRCLLILLRRRRKRAGLVLRIRAGGKGRYREAPKARCRATGANTC